MYYFKYPELVNDYQQVVKNAERYVLDLEKDERLVKKLSQVQHWYYIKSDIGYVFAPSKFIGYQNNNVDYYERFAKRGMTGSDTEKRLLKWFVVVEKNSKLEILLRDKLIKFVGFYDKKLHKNACIHISQDDLKQDITEYESYINNKLESNNQKVASVNEKDFIVYYDDMDPNESYIEGSVLTVKVNRYERNQEARRKCIEIHGCQCKICGFDFEKVYGQVGKGLIHVHHVVPISTIKEEYQIDYEKDLIPVCPNCHAIIHRKKDPYTPEEIRTMYKENNNEEM